jgi:hypothetical protein
LDGDGHSRLEEYTAGTNPNDPQSACKVSIRILPAEVQVSFPALRAEGAGYEGRNRFYALESAASLAPESWKVVPDFARVHAANQTVVFAAPFGREPSAFYQTRVWLEGP